MSEGADVDSPTPVVSRAIAAGPLFSQAIALPKLQPRSKRKPKPQPKPSRLFRTQEAAHYLSISPWTLRNLVHNGDLPVVSIGDGSPWRFDQRDLDAYIERNKRTEPY